jgi:ligand-binding sensor domain-containing protein/two-component sensor histidine kinase
MHINIIGTGFTTLRFGLRRKSNWYNMQQLLYFGLAVALKKLLIIIVVLLGSAHGFAQKSIELSMLDVKAGLPQGFIPAITQDDNGFMWFGGKQGVLRFDGYKYINLSHNELDSTSLATNYITQLMPLAGHYLAAVSDFGNFEIINARTLQIVHVKNIPNTNLRYLDKFGLVDNLDNGKKYYHADSTLYEIQLKESKAKAQVEFIKLTQGAHLFKSMRPVFVNASTYLFARDSNENILIGTHNILSKEQRQINIANTGKLIRVLRIAENFVMVLTTKKLYVVNCSLGTYEQIEDKYYSVAAVVDAQHRIWLPFGNKAYAYDYKTKTAETYLIDNADSRKKLNSTQSISCSFIDKQNIIWIGTPGYGIIKLNPFHAAFNTIRPELNSSVYNFVALSADTIQMLIGEQDFYLNTRKNTFTLATDYNSKCRAIEPGIRADRLGLVDQVCLPGNQLRTYNLRQRTSTLRQFDKALEQQQKIFIQQLPSGKFILLTEGLGRKYTIFQLAKDLSIEQQCPLNLPYTYGANLVPHGLYANQKFYFATLSGLVIYDITNNTVQNYQKSSSALGKSIYDLCLDENNLWIATATAGLARLNLLSNKVDQFTTADGLPDNVIYKILMQGDKLWLSTNMGLCCFNKTDKSCCNFGSTDGLQNSEFNRMAGCILPNSEIFFGGIDGLNRFFAKDVLKLAYTSKLKFTSINVQQNELLLSNSSKLILDSAAQPLALNLDYKDNFVLLDVSLADYINPAQCRYFYKIQGLHEDWIALNANNRITLTNLPIGNFVLMAKALNSRGSWSPIVNLNIHVQPPWWRTWWAICCGILLLAGIIYGVLQYRIHQVRNIERLKNRISSDLHDEIGSSLTSLNIYNNLAQKHASDKSKKYLDRSETVLQKVIENLNDIVWSLNSRNEALDSLATRMQGSTVVQTLQLQGYKVQVNSSDRCAQILLSNEQRKNLLLCLKEACNNALKYANGNLLTIDIDYTNKLVQATVRDNGVGFEINDAKLGNGLLNIKERMKNIGGTASITSAPGTGCVVKISFPLS